VSQADNVVRQFLLTENSDSSLTGETNSTNNPPPIVLNKPIFIEHIRSTSYLQINQTHSQIFFSGNGTLMLPTINSNSSTTTITNADNGIPSVAAGPTIATIIKTNDTGSAVIFKQGNGFTFSTGTTLINSRGAVFIKTNSTGQLAILNNTVGILQDQFGPEFHSVKIWNWSIDKNEGGVITNHNVTSSNASLSSSALFGGSTSEGSTTTSNTGGGDNIFSGSTDSQEDTTGGSGQMADDRTGTGHNTKSKEFDVKIEIAKDPIVRGNDQEITVIVSDKNTDEKIKGAKITEVVEYASGKSSKHFDGVTDSDGKYSSPSWKIGPDSKPGTFDVQIDISAGGYRESRASDSFEVISATDNDATGTGTGTTTEPSDDDKKTPSSEISNTDGTNDTDTNN